MSVFPVFSFPTTTSDSLSQSNPMITFVVEGQELHIESHLLEVCDYFKTMLSSGLQESITRRIVIQETSKETVEIFLNFLKTKQLPPTMNTEQLIELYHFVHQYQHQALLVQIGRLLNTQAQEANRRKDYSFPAVDLLVLACLYNDRSLKEACRNYVLSSHSYQSFMLQLIDREAYDALREVLTWKAQQVELMTIYPSGNKKETAVFKLFNRGMYLLASDVLKFGQRHMNNMNQELQELVREILNQESHLSPEQIELLSTVSAKIYNMMANSSLLFIPLFKGWNAIFEMLLSHCKESVYQITNTEKTTLLSVAIAHHRVEAIKALRAAHPPQKPFSFLVFSNYILESIKTRNPAVLKEVLSFGKEHSYPGSILELDFACMEAALETKNLNILKIVLPYFKGYTYEDDPFDLQALLFKILEKESCYPLHLIFADEDPSLLREFLSRAPDLLLVNSKKQNFFHLSCKTTTTVLPFTEFKEQIEKVDLKAFDQKDIEGNTPLHDAIHHQKYAESFLLFQKNNAALWETNAQGETPFNTLGGEEFEKMMEFFVTAAAEESVHEDARRALLLWCAQHYLYPFCEKLIPLTQDIKTIQAPGGKNLLHLASEAGAVFAISKLLELGFNVNSKDDLQTTPLHIAVKRRDVDLVQGFIEAGASPKICDFKGETPLSLALKDFATERSVALQAIVRTLESKSCAVQ